MSLGEIRTTLRVLIWFCGFLILLLGGATWWIALWVVAVLALTPVVPR